MITCRVDPDQRTAQFENIEKLRAHYGDNAWPVLSAATKKKEFLGRLYRDGKFYSQDGRPLVRYDHDSPHLAEGRVVPHRIFHINLNKEFITLGTSAETLAFAAESLWGGGTTAGGANAARSVQFKHRGSELAARTGLEIRAAHYPPYCSKWSPIKHRLFPHLTRGLQGVYLDSNETIGKYVNEQATTSTGLKTRAYILDKEFPRGVREDLLLPDGPPLERHDELPEWNFTCHPQTIMMS